MKEVCIILFANTVYLVKFYKFIVLPIGAREMPFADFSKTKILKKGKI